MMFNLAYHTMSELDKNSLGYTDKKLCMYVSCPKEKNVGGK